MSAIGDFIAGFKRGYRRVRYSKSTEEIVYVRRWFRTRRAALEWAVMNQLQQIEDVGISDDFQAGYVEAMVHVWSSAGYPDTPMVETARRLVRDHICKEPESAL